MLPTCTTVTAYGTAMTWHLPVLMWKYFVKNKMVENGIIYVLVFTSYNSEI
jgi:hypothetical protein